MSVIKRRLTLDAIDTLFEKYSDIDEIIEKFYRGKPENTPEANLDVLYEDDNMRIVATGHYITPSSTPEHPVPEKLKNIKIYDAIMETRENEDDDFEPSCSVIYISFDDDWYYETESYIAAALHNAFGVDLGEISSLRYNLCV